jgi:cell division protein FtsI/penicillin-binding protein 2
MKKPPAPPADPNRFMPHRMAFVAGMLLVLFAVLGWRLYEVQIVHHDLWAARGEDMVRQKRILPAMRGPIRDCNGELLAHDKVVHDVWINLRNLRDLNDVRARLAKVEKTSVKELSASSTDEEIFTRYQQFVSEVMAEAMGRIGVGEEPPASDFDATIAANGAKAELPWVSGLQEDKTAQWKQALEDAEIVAVTVRPRVQRFYPCAERLTHVLGYVNERAVDPTTGRVFTDEDIRKFKAKIEQYGCEGIEGSMNAQLTGKDGYQLIERDRHGNELMEFRGETVPPQHGHEVRLTIDMHLQDTMEEVLEEAYAFHRPRRITAVVVDPLSGAVLAMASRPHIDREAKDGINANLAVAGKYEPGSVFKVVTYTAALDAKVASLDDTINCDPGQAFLEKLSISDHYSGVLKVSDAFAFSSNRGAYVLAHRLGEKRFLEGVERFGFGKPTGIMLTGESSGMLHHPGTKWWDGLTFSRMSYGHAIQVTPLQMCMAVAAIANGGTLMKPQIVKEVRDDSGEIVQTYPPEPVRRVCSQKTAGLMRKAMIGVVENPKGTGVQAAIPGVTVAGKTGTSQLYNATGSAIKAGHYCVSFAGFAPAENPALCAIIVVDDPVASGEALTGGKLAAPIFSRLVQRCLQNIAVSRVGQPVATSETKGIHP